MKPDEATGVNRAWMRDALRRYTTDMKAFTPLGASWEAMPEADREYWVDKWMLSDPIRYVVPPEAVIVARADLDRLIAAAIQLRFIVTNNNGRGPGRREADAIDLGLLARVKGERL